MMFDRSIRQAANAQGGDFLFNCLDDTLSQADATVANLEGPITDNPSRSVGSSVGEPDNFVFTFAPSTAALLAAHHITAVNLGNNHIENFGASGVASTISYLQAANVGYFGQPVDAHALLAANTAVLVSNGVHIALINYNEFDQSSSVAKTIAQIAAAKRAGNTPVVYTHWGVEYQAVAPQYVRDIAHQFADAGAAIVIGSHPHVVEDNEVYHAVPIYYSLGNLIFDQYFSEAVTHGLMLKVTFSDKGVQKVQEQYVALGRNRQTCPVNYIRN
jgi:poly-gamma-glutamate capsule biosynthesis protein CapA/YwtB (metallophosphatase superfamily)